MIDLLKQRYGEMRERMDTWHDEDDRKLLLEFIRWLNTDDGGSTG